MTDLLSIGSSALLAYRTALATTGSNVANAQTGGYVRRRANIHELPYASGSAVGGIVRSWDAITVDRSRAASGSLAQAGTGSTWLGRIEATLGSGAGSVGPALSSFFAAATRLAGDPGSTTLRAGFIDGLGHVATTFNRTASELSALGTAIGEESSAALATINDRLDQLARINDSLRTSNAGSEARATLEDERDRLIDDLSGLIAVECKYGADGAVRLSTPDSPDIPLLDRDGAGQLSIVDGTLYLSHPDGTQAISASGGTLAGLDQARAALARRIADLDALAGDFAAAINGWSAGGNTDSGAPGTDIMAGSSAVTLRVTLQDPNAIAAAANGTTNGNLLALETIRASGRFEQRWDDLVSINAAMLARQQSDTDAATALHDQAQAAREAVSAVDLDSEAADLVAMQQAYGAAARIIQTAREAFDAFLNRL